ncbi:hypothetical protein LshimejAT787_1800840 [Lyophyllum shimeji]|uniref:Uncharacterized protein n=1 Tax=Lyophyllum shimeji TaxID=47721 RepID=A0A9P3Q0S1_LYOSH|nr:hypothetical protein LshimejAT787_1800840 [Lyophyllum shimeji]
MTGGRRFHSHFQQHVVDIKEVTVFIVPCFADKRQHTVTLGIKVQTTLARLVGRSEMIKRRRRGKEEDMPRGLHVQEHPLEYDSTNLRPRLAMTDYAYGIWYPDPST